MEGGVGVEADTVEGDVEEGRGEWGGGEKVSDGGEAWRGMRRARQTRRVGSVAAAALT